VATVLPALNVPTAKSATDETGWTSLASMPTERGHFGVAVVSGKIYAIGGLNGNGVLNTVEEYNPVTNIWTPKAPMPISRSDFAIAVYHDKIYVIGGVVGNGFVGNNEVYTPASNTWETKSSMPTPRGALSASVVNDQIYLVGGKKYSGTTPFWRETDINEVYSPANDTWSTKKSIPSAVEGYTSAAVNNKIYFIGGFKQLSTQDNQAIVNSNQIYDPQTDQWSFGTIMPTVSTYGAAAATEGFMAPVRIYVIGGFSSGIISGVTSMLDPDKNSWAFADPMPTAREYLSVTVINDVLYALGGFDGVNWLNTNERYKPFGYGVVAPIIQITSPENKTYTNVSIAYTVNRGIDWIAYSLDNEANVTLNSNTQLIGLAQGEHNIIIYANDSVDNMGSSNTVFFSIDTLPPTIDLLTPQNQTYSATDIQLSFKLNEAVSYLAYSLDGQEKVPIIGNITLPAVSNGSHRLTVYANDTLGNAGSETVYFNIATFPTLTLVAVLATVTIVLASAYIIFKRRKPSSKEEVKQKEKEPKEPLQDTYRWL
jgi:hypothetical protein